MKTKDEAVDKVVVDGDVDTESLKADTLIV